MKNCLQLRLCGAVGNRTYRAWGKLLGFTLSVYKRALLDNQASIGIDGD